MHERPGHVRRHGEGAPRGDSQTHTLLGSVLLLALVLATNPRGAAQVPVLDWAQFGDEASEHEHAFEESGSVREQGGLGEPCRRLGADGYLPSTFDCDPDEPNYLTVKLWGSGVGPAQLYLYEGDERIGAYHAEGSRHYQREDLVPRVALALDYAVWYRATMEASTTSGPTWPDLASADEQAAVVVGKQGETRLVMSLNRRHGFGDKPGLNARSPHNAAANNLPRVHHTTPTTERVANVPMASPQGFAGLYLRRHGPYRVLRNAGWPRLPEDGGGPVSFTVPEGLPETAVNLMDGNTVELRGDLPCPRRPRWCSSCERRQRTETEP